MTTSMAFCAIDFSRKPWGWRDVVKRHKHYFFCQVHGTSTWVIDDEPVQVPAGHGVWLPRGTKYSAEFSPGDVICALGFREADSPATTGPAVIAIDPELEGLLTRFSSPFAFRADPDTARVEIMAAVERIVRLPVDLILPTTPAARSVADRILREPGSSRTLSQWAAWSHCSPRALQRAFAAETGRGFTQWRQACRMDAARRLLRTGRPIASVARRVGYTSHSSFSRAYKEYFGVAPSTSSAA